MTVETAKGRTLDRYQATGDLVKPVELIAVSGGENLGLAERRIYNLLIKNAFGPDLGVPGHHFTIATRDLKDGTGSNTELGASLEKLMRTIVRVRMSNGNIERVQLLGWNSLVNRGSAYGTLEYSIPPELAGYLKNSTLFARLEVAVLRAFSSKYSLSLYEQVSQWARMDYVRSREYSLEEFRDVMGVPAGKLERFSMLNLKVITPAVFEVNALADFNVTIEHVKAGRKVTGLRVYWGQKGMAAKRAAYAEIQQPKAGRRARLQGKLD